MVLKVSSRTFLVLELSRTNHMTFARTIVEQNIVPHKILQLSINILENFLNSSRVVLEHSSIKLKNFTRIVQDHFAGVHKYSRNTNLLTYVHMRSVHMTFFAHGG